MHMSINCQFANSTMTAAHKVSAERESIGIAEKRQQYFDICEYRFHLLF